MFDVFLVARYMLKKKVFYPDRSIGVSKIARDLGLAPSRVIRALRYLRMLGFVVRNSDPLRQKYSSWSLARHVDLRVLESFLAYFWGEVVGGKLSIFEWLDSFLDKYFFSGTTALIMNGFSWNDVSPKGILILVDKDERRRVNRFLEFYGKTSLWRDYPVDIVFVDDIHSCEYRVVKLENSAVPLASVPQAIVDAIVNMGRSGVDIFETLSVLVGVFVPRILESDDKGFVLRIIGIAERIYRNKYQLVVSVLVDIFMRFYLYFEDSSALDMYLIARDKLERFEIPPRILRILDDAFRATVLGDRVAMYLGLEPDFDSKRAVRVPEKIFAVAEL